MNAMRHQEVTRSADYVVPGLCNHADRLSLWLKGSHGDLSDELTLRIDTKDTVLGSGLKFLLSTDRPRDMQLINQTTNYEAMLSALSSLARFIILDLGVGIHPFAQKVLPHCDKILIVLEGTPNVISHTRVLIDDMASMNINRKNINVVLINRIRSDTQLPTSQVQNKLDFEILGTLTPAPELFTQATRMQTPAVLCQPDSLTARQANKLVEFIAEHEALPRDTCRLPYCRRTHPASTRSSICGPGSSVTPWPTIVPTT